MGKLFSKSSFQDWSHRIKFVNQFLILLKNLESLLQTCRYKFTYITMLKILATLLITFWDLT